MSKMTMPEPDEIDVLWLDEGNREWLDGKECSVLGEHEFRALLEAYAAAKVREALEARNNQER